MSTSRSTGDRQADGEGGHGHHQRPPDRHQEGHTQGQQPWRLWRSWRRQGWLWRWIWWIRWRIWRSLRWWLRGWLRSSSRVRWRPWRCGWQDEGRPNEGAWEGPQQALLGPEMIQ